MTHETSFTRTGWAVLPLRDIQRVREWLPLDRRNDGRMSVEAAIPALVRRRDDEIGHVLDEDAVR